MVCGLHEWIEGVVGRHVLEVRSAGNVYFPTLGQRDYLTKLGAGEIVVRSESVVRIARYDAVTVKEAHSFIEIVGGIHICEGDRAWGSRDSDRGRVGGRIGVRRRTLRWCRGSGAIARRQGESQLQPFTQVAGVALILGVPVAGIDNT